MSQRNPPAATSSSSSSSSSTSCDDDEKPPFRTPPLPDGGCRRRAHSAAAFDNLTKAGRRPHSRRHSPVMSRTQSYSVDSVADKHSSSLRSGSRVRRSSKSSGSRSASRRTSRHGSRLVPARRDGTTSEAGADSTTAAQTSSRPSPPLPPDSLPPPLPTIPSSSLSSTAGIFLRRRVRRRHHRKTSSSSRHHSTASVPAVDNDDDSASSSLLFDGDLLEQASQQRRLLRDISKLLSDGTALQQREALLLQIDVMCSTPLDTPRSSNEAHGESYDNDSSGATTTKRVMGASIEMPRLRLARETARAAPATTSSTRSVMDSPTASCSNASVDETAESPCRGRLPPTPPRRLSWSSSRPPSPLRSSRRSPLSVSSRAVRSGVVVVDFGADDSAVDLHERLGGGASGVVYRATVDGMTMACKVYEDGTSALRSSDSTAASSSGAYSSGAVLDEQATALDRLCALRHAHVVRHFGWRRTSGGRLLLFMELLDETLRDVIVGARDGIGYVEPVVVVDYLHQIASGLVYLHTDAPTPLIHRDLKSENVFLRRNGYSDKGKQDAVGGSRTLKIGDLDEAREISSTCCRRTRLSRSTRQQRRRLSFNVGTFQFMAPEMMAESSVGCSEDQTYNEKVDVWSFGMVIFELLTLDVPYRAECLASNTRESHTTEYVRRLVTRGIRPTLPPAPALLSYRARAIRTRLVNLFVACTKLLPSDRPSAVDVVRFQVAEQVLAPTLLG